MDVYTRWITIVGICLLLSGCAALFPGSRGALAIILPLIAAFAAIRGWMYTIRASRIQRKANELDEHTTAHIQLYHGK